MISEYPAHISMMQTVDSHSDLMENLTCDSTEKTEE